MPTAKVLKESLGLSPAQVQAVREICSYQWIPSSAKFILKKIAAAIEAEGSEHLGDGIYFVRLKDMKLPTFVYDSKNDKLVIEEIGKVVTTHQKRLGLVDSDKAVRKIMRRRACPL